MAEPHHSRAATTRSNAMGGEGLRTFTLLFAYPALRQLPYAEWDEALEQAREGSFETLEWLGIVAGAAFATYLSRFDVGQAAAVSLPVRYVFQFLAAVPLLTLIVGPLYLRRTRRGLDQAIERRRGPGPIHPTG